MTSGHRFPYRWRLADLKPPAADAPTVFSTFACAGGSTMGYKLAGYRTLGCCEIDPTTNNVYKTNLHPKYNYVEDIRDFVKRDDLPDELYDLDVLDGSPPCTTFSMAGDREKSWGVEKRFAEGQKSQTLDDLYFVYADLVAKLRPKAFISENVAGLIKGNARAYVTGILKKFRSIGYDVQVFLLNAMYMGVPQSRERTFIVGNRIGAPKLSLSFDEEPIKFGEFRTREGVEVRDGKLKDTVAARRVGDTKIADTNMRVTGQYSMFTNLYAYDDRPLPTITSSGVMIRFFDGMRLSECDMVLGSSFPEDYDFCKSSISKTMFYVGMSVPPVMMANIAYEVRKQWLGK